MFPNSEDLPPTPPEPACHFPIPGNVSGELCLPEGSVASRHLAVLGAYVPEAPVDKHGYTQLREHKIWIAEDLLMPAPPCDAICAKDPDHCQLRALVPARAYVKHYIVF
jgi:hypothetical protein